VGRQRPRALALVAVAGGQIEVAFEVGLLADDLRVAEDEAVRVEEAAQIDVGEDPSRRRVSGARSG